MAIVYCKSCKSKMTQRDTVCPKCGSTNSRLVPVLACIIFSAAGLFIYNTYRQSVNQESTAIASEADVPAAAANSVEILRIGHSEQE